MNNPIQVFEGEGDHFPAMQKIACRAILNQAPAYDRPPSDDWDEDLEWFQVLCFPLRSSWAKDLVPGLIYSLEFTSEAGAVHTVQNQRLKAIQFQEAKGISPDLWILWFHPPA